MQVGSLPGSLSETEEQRGIYKGCWTCRGLAPLDGFSQVGTALLLCGPGTADVCLGQSVAALPAGWKATKTQGQGFLFTLCHLK